MKRSIPLLVALLLVTFVFPAFAGDCLSDYGMPHDEIIVEKKQATCTEDGYEVVRCAREGCSYSETFVYKKYGHDFSGGVCLRCGALESTPVPEPTSTPTIAPTDTPTPTPAPTETPAPVFTLTPVPTNEPTPSSETAAPLEATQVPSLAPVATPTRVPVLSPLPSSVPSSETPVPFIPTLPPDETPVFLSPAPDTAVTLSPTEVPILPIAEVSATPVPVPTAETLPAESVTPASNRSANSSKDNAQRKEDVWDLEISFSLPGTDEKLLFLTKKTGSPQKAEDPADPYQYEATLSYLSGDTDPILLLQGRCWFSAAVHGEREDNIPFHLTITRFPQLAVTFESASVSVSFLPDADQSISLLLRILGLEATDSPLITTELSGTDYAP